VQFEFTPKALANYNPGLFQPWGKRDIKNDKTLKALGCAIRTPSEFERNMVYLPRVATTLGLN
jgi:hypothetical protein